MQAGRWKACDGRGERAAAAIRQRVDFMVVELSIWFGKEDGVRGKEERKEDYSSFTDRMVTVIVQCFVCC